MRRLLLVALIVAGCRRRPTTAPAPVVAHEEHCWWAVLRAGLPPDSVAAGFQRAYTSLGLRDAAWTRAGDTAWVHGGPAPLPVPVAGATYAARAVAYLRGDSTHFRYYVAIAPPAGGWARPEDSTAALSQHIGLCRGIAGAVGFRWSTPRAPDDEAALPLWSRSR